MDAVAFYKFTVGDFNVTVIQDGMNGMPATIYGVNTDESNITGELNAHNLPTDVAATTLNVVLLQTDDKTVLFDAGQGDFVISEPHNAGRLVNTLAMLGVQPEDVDTVVVTHFHPDHIGGVSDGETATFPNATYMLSTEERDFLHIENPPEALAPYVDFANARLKPMHDAGKLEFYNDGDDIIAGVTAIHSPGHTHGHYAFMLESNGQQLFHMVDTSIHWVLSVKHPDWYFGIDSLPDIATETRKRNLSKAADEGLQVLGYHFPFPGIGTIARDGEAGFRFVPKSS